MRLTHEKSAHTFKHMKTSAAGLREIEAVCLYGEHFDRDDEDVQEAKRRLQAKLASSSAGTVIPLDLAGAWLRSSCLGEILGGALEGIVEGNYEGRYVVVLDPNRRHEFDLDAALEKESKDRERKLVCVWRCGEGRTALLGQVDPQVDRTYEFVLRAWTTLTGATARAYAEEEGIKIQAAGNRLSKAASLGVIHPAERVPVSGGGSQWFYVPVE